MRKYILPLAAAAAAVGIAAPASAQQVTFSIGTGYGHSPYGYGGYGYSPYGYNQYGHSPYGYNQYAHPRALQARLNQMQRQIRYFDQRNMVSEREADRLYAQSVAIERRLRRASFNGFSPWEAQDLQRRVAALEYRLQRGARYAYRGW